MPASAADYGDANAAFYDQIYPRIDRRVLDCLQSLAGGRAALELGVGTGRCARPLAARGVGVVGMDASAAMLARCRALDPVRALQLVRADIASLPFRGGFGLVYALVNTLSLLPDRAAQRAALCGVAAALDDDGCFVDEGGAAPNAPPADAPQVVEVPWIGSPSGVYRFRALPLTPSLLDELAECAGLRRVARWRDWSGNAWRAGDAQSISIYRRIS